MFRQKFVETARRVSGDTSDNVGYQGRVTLDDAAPYVGEILNELLRRACTSQPCLCRLGRLFDGPDDRPGDCRYAIRELVEGERIRSGQCECLPAASLAEQELHGNIGNIPGIDPRCRRARGGHHNDAVFADQIPEEAVVDEVLHEPVRPQYGVVEITLLDNTLYLALMRVVSARLGCDFREQHDLRRARRLRQTREVLDNMRHLVGLGLYKVDSVGSIQCGSPGRAVFPIECQRDDVFLCGE